MKWPKRQTLKADIANKLLLHHNTKQPMPGISNDSARYALSMQIVASIRRDEYFQLIQKLGDIRSGRADPNCTLFEAELAVVHFLQNGLFDEAAWLVFLMVYLAKPAESGWKRLQDIYGRLGDGRWDWASVSENPEAFEKWLAINWESIGGKFGNHRKYESLNPNKARPMGPAVTTYVRWVNAAGGHKSLFDRISGGANDPHVVFDAFYHAVPFKGFGRLGRFDWAAMLSRYGFARGEAGSAYLQDATGPKSGLSLLFCGDPKADVHYKTIQKWLDALDADLQVGMEVLEDSVCNWQKTPNEFKHFRG